MLSINKVFPRFARKYNFKNTVSAKYERNLKASIISSSVLLFEAQRLRELEAYEVPILALATTLFVPSFVGVIKNAMALIPIKKRAKSIKNVSKI